MSTQKISHDSETPARGQQVFTACAFIHQKFDGTEKVFLAKRAVTKKFLPDVWEIPGGHVDYGEDMVSGLQREFKEEFGMRIHVGDPFEVFTYTNQIKGSHSIQVTYFASFIDPLEGIQISADDHSAYGWFAEDEIAELFKDWMKTIKVQEVNTIVKGFKLLRGESVNFGSRT